MFKVNNKDTRTMLAMSLLLTLNFIVLLSLSLNKKVFPFDESNKKLESSFLINERNIRCYLLNYCPKRAAILLPARA